MTTPKNRVDENVTAATFDDFGSFTNTFTLRRPDGRQFSVTLRALTDADTEGIRAKISWPQRSGFIKDFIREAGKQPVPVYNDEAFEAAERVANSLLASRMLASSIVMDIPGETLEEKADALKSKLGSWASRELSTKMMIMSGITEAEVEKALGNLIPEA